MGHSVGFGYALWAVAKDLVKRYGLGAAFGYALWALAQNQSPQHRTSHNSF
jgi:hypothetical protein